jgi:peptidoglycan/xylan/chitin deacetylase (PgdA/CDA1 family)
MMNPSVLPRLALAATLFIPQYAFGVEVTDAKPEQIVLISFDGAHDNAQWQRSLALGKKTGAKFTYFLNCVFLLSPEHKMLFDAPEKGAGKSNVGFGKSKADVSARLGHIWQAHTVGHEIASHTCGHFDGKFWTAADYAKDRAEFRAVMADAWKINGEQREPFGWRAFVDASLKGLRAPYLSTGPGLEAHLRSGGYLYDASGVERGISQPKMKAGVLRFALPTVPEGPEGRRIVAMDYNLFVRHSGGFERTDIDGTFEKRTLDALYKAFNGQYSGARNPVQFGLHFTLMNGGAYWRAVETFAADVCVRPDVKCITYEKYAQSHAASKLAAAWMRRGGS